MTCQVDQAANSAAETQSDIPLRIGVLGAARIAELAIVEPSHAHRSRLVSIAARDAQRAQAYADEHGFEGIAASYAELLQNPDVEVVYNPLPNALHGPWNLEAIRAGKNVLSEKPFASNAGEARRVHEAALEAGVTVVDGFHYLYHPVVQRLLELLRFGELGELIRLEAKVCMPDPGAEDPRWSLALAGGAMMDLGCYGIHLARVLGEFAGGAPTVQAARSCERGTTGVDEWLDTDLVYPSGATASVLCHMVYSEFDMSCRVVGTRGKATIANFVQPHLDDRIIIDLPGGSAIEHAGTRSSYLFQLEALHAAVREGRPMPTDSADALRTMELIDQAYVASGLEPRPELSELR